MMTTMVSVAKVQDITEMLSKSQVASRRGRNANRISSAYVLRRATCSTDVDNEVILNTTVSRPAYE
jgi:hypothetical protein